MNERKSEEKNLLQAFYGSKAFFKIKQCLEIGKIQFSFVDKANAKNFINCYMEAEEFGAILINSIKNGTLLKALELEKAKNDTYPKAIFTSPVGGNATGNNGSPISRYFTISPGSTSEVLFTAYAFPAEKSSTGAFIKKKGSNALITLRIPCSVNDLKILAYKWSYLEKDYMGKKYCLENMKSEYTTKCEDSFAPTEYEETTSSDTVIDTKEDIPFVSGSSSHKEEKSLKGEILKLTAISKLNQVPKKPIKVCFVKQGDSKKQLICLTDKFVDQKKLSDFENQLTSRIDSNKTLDFKAEVVSKGETLYLCKFA